MQHTRKCLICGEQHDLDQPLCDTCWELADYGCLELCHNCDGDGFVVVKEWTDTRYNPVTHNRDEETFADIENCPHCKGRGIDPLQRKIYLLVANPISHLWGNSTHWYDWYFEALGIRLEHGELIAEYRKRVLGGKMTNGNEGLKIGDVVFYSDPEFPAGHPMSLTGKYILIDLDGDHAAIKSGNGTIGVSVKHLKVRTGS